MKKYIFPSAVIGLLLVIGLAGFKLYDTQRFLPADLVNGKAKYEANCLSCHGDKGHGDGIASEGLTISADNIYEEITNPFGSKLELTNSILEGDNGQGGLMPAFKGVLTERDVSDILEYIRSIN